MITFCASLEPHHILIWISCKQIFTPDHNYDGMCRFKILLCQEGFRGKEVKGREEGGGGDLLVF